MALCGLWVGGVWGGDDDGETSKAGHPEEEEFVRKGATKRTACGLSMTTALHTDTDASIHSVCVYAASKDRQGEADTAERHHDDSLLADRHRQVLETRNRVLTFHTHTTHTCTQARHMSTARPAAMPGAAAAGSRPLLPSQQQQEQQQQQQQQQQQLSRTTRRPGGPASGGTTALTDQWMDFAERAFVAEEYAEGFFLTHSEAEAEERCAELMNLRYQTQDLLRHKVSSHYQLFMRGTEDIQHVEADIAKLRRLVGRMQESLKALDQASSTILMGDAAGGGGGGAAAAGAAGGAAGATAAAGQGDERGNARMSMRGAPGGVGGNRAGNRMSVALGVGGGERSRRPSLDGVGRMSVRMGLSSPSSTSASSLQPSSSSSSSSSSTGYNSTDASKHLPKWVTLALEDLERCMIEKQRSAAVGHIKKIRTYLFSLPPSTSAAAVAAHKDLSLLVTRRADEMASRVIQDLESMAPSTSLSILFDFSDMARQLKLLILLGKSGTAVDFFIRNRGGMIARSLRLLEAGGDTLAYVTLLAERFFGLMAEACVAFEALFAVSSTAVTAAPVGGGKGGKAGGKEGGKEVVVIVRPPECFSRLVLWVEGEVRHFAALVGRQLGMMRRDLLVGQRSSGSSSSSSNSSSSGAKSLRRVDSLRRPLGSLGMSGSSSLNSSSSSSSRATTSGYIAPPPPPPSPGASSSSSSSGSTTSSSFFPPPSVLTSAISISSSAAAAAAASTAGGGVGVAPYAYLSSARSNLLMKMLSMPQSPMGQSHHFLQQQQQQSSPSLPPSLTCDPSFITIGACLEVCFTLAGRLDTLGLPLRPSFASVLTLDLLSLLQGVAHTALLRVEEAVENEGGREGGVVVSAEALMLVTPMAVTAQGDSLLGGEGGRKGGEEIATATTEVPSSSSSASSSSSTTPPRLLPVLPSTLLLLGEINSLIVSWVMMKESKGARVRYSDLVGPALDGGVVREVCGLLRGYVEKVEGRLSKEGEGGGGGGGGKGVNLGATTTTLAGTAVASSSSSSSEKKLTPAEMKERAVAAEALEALLGVTLWELSRAWINDPLVLVDPTSAVNKDIKPVQDVYARVIEVLNEASGKAAAARSAAAAAAAAAAASAALAAPGSPLSPSGQGGGKAAPTSAFSRLTMGR